MTPQEIKRILMSIRDFVDRTNKKKERVQALKHAAEGVDAIRYDKERVNSSPDNFNEKALLDAIELEAEIEEDIAANDELKMNMYEYIRQIQDDEQQSVILNYYYNRMYWSDIAREMYISEKTIFGIHEAAIIELANIYGSK